MKLAMKIVFVAGVASLAATTASAFPAIDGGVAAQSGTHAAPLDRVYYRCGYYGCYHRRFYRVYRPYYGYGYYNPYYYRPHIGIGLGGVGIGLY